MGNVSHRQQKVIDLLDREVHMGNVSHRQQKVYN
jgi:hypothetical protein